MVDTIALGIWFVAFGITQLVPVQSANLILGIGAFIVAVLLFV